MMMIPYCGVVCEEGEEGGEVKARVFQEESAAFPDHGFDHHQHQEPLVLPEYQEMLNFLIELQTKSPTAPAAPSHYEVLKT